MYPSECRAIEAYNSRGTIQGDSVLYKVLTGKPYYGTPFGKLPKMPISDSKQRGKIGKFPSQRCLLIALLGEETT